MLKTRIRTGLGDMVFLDSSLPSVRRHSAMVDFTLLCSLDHNIQFFFRAHGPEHRPACVQRAEHAI